MQSLVCLLAATLILGIAPSVRTQSPATDSRAVLAQYCFTCHNDRLKTGGLSLEKMDLASVGESPVIWEKVVRRLRTGAMPPAPSRRPDQATYDRLTSWLEGELDKHAAAHPNPGRPAVHRLNRSEYASAIHDLLDLDVNVASLLPPDDSAYGFDNVADVLGVSPVLLERYLNAADEISALAVGDREISPGSESYHVRHDLSQDQHVDGLPLGTVGGTLIHHTFPLDATYVIQVKLFRTNLNAIRGMEWEQQLEIAVDGQRVHLAPVGGRADLLLMGRNPTDGSDEIETRLQVRVPIKAGPRSVGVTFVQKSPALGTVRLQPYLRSSADTFEQTGRPHVQTVNILGPYDITGPGDTPSRRRIFVCRPASAKDELPCARTILSTIARRAYRRPLAKGEIEPLMAFFEAGRRDGSFDTGIQLALQRILATPKFVFRIEQDPADAGPGEAYRIADLELASRLSFFLWSSIPDDELLTLAAQGKLKNPQVLEQQVRRMLADPRSRALVSNFAGQWLQVRNLRSVAPNSNEFPDFDDNLRQAFQRETEMFFESIMREDRNVVDLMTADYTFLNERLAIHYGIPGVRGDQFRRVTLTDDARKGLLGKGSILLVTSHADRTSPVVRGKWILENLLGTPPPSPPQVVPPLKENEEGVKPLTMRAKMEEHRANPVCASCHKMMDPIGFTLENFDAVGAWRARDAGEPIDASGQFVDGTAVDGVVTLRHALLKRPDVFVRTMTQKMLTYALGRGVEDYDMPAVRAIVRDSATQDYRFSSLVLGIVNSAPFQMRVKAADPVVAAGFSRP
jgi:Protein of unknown function (DUF1592)/Protein of unknown function (DUF1588)/Protein of unknown function (DUF1585)/Protein of unknown function (DUF1587)/Protein of unknown function (DUF1595)